jgi:hypothetical protein
MRHLPSWLIVGAIGILVALAAADAIRPHTESKPTPAKAETSAPASLSGVVVVAGPDCSVSALHLPDLAEQNPPRQPDCGGLLWTRDGSLAARCTPDNGSLVLTADLEFTARAAGCAFGWRDDGSLSLVRHGDLVLWRRRGGERSVMTQAQLVQQLKGRAERLERPETYRFAEVSWGDESSFAAILQGDRPWETAIARFTNGTLDWLVPVFGSHAEGLRTNAGGSVAYARAVPVREYRVLGADGREVKLPRIGNANDLAWSPDEKWVAIETRTRTFLARPGRTKTVELLLGGESIDWMPSG